LGLTRPGIGGLEALPHLREAAPSCEVVMLTASVAEENLLAAVRAGAAGYLLKTEPPERIVEFLRGAAGGEAALSGSIARRLLERVRQGRDADAGVPDSIARALSAREVEVLLLLDEHLGTDQIATRLFISGIVPGSPQRVAAACRRCSRPRGPHRCGAPARQPARPSTRRPGS